jgi:uncharacterized RDD family membrane protein YckC
MFCSACGGPLQPNEQFCPKCGQAAAFAAPAAYAAQPGVSAPAHAFARRYAGFWLRVVAYLVDGLILGIPLGGIILIVILAMGGFAAMHSSLPAGEPDQTALVALIGAFLGFYLVVLCFTLAASWLYFALMESSPRQATLGKSLLSLRVTDKNGQRLSFGHATGRYFSKIITGLVPLGIGYILAGVTEKKQALHDFIAGTLVFRDN